MGGFQGESVSRESAFCESAFCESSFCESSLCESSYHQFVHPTHESNLKQLMNEL